MKTLFTLLCLAACGCAAFEAPVVRAGETRCIVGDCSGLTGTMSDLADPAFNARVQAAHPGEPRQ